MKVVQRGRSQQAAGSRQEVPLAEPQPLGKCPLTFLHLSCTRFLVSCLSPNVAPYLSAG